MNLANHLTVRNRKFAMTCLRVAFYVFLGGGLAAVGYATYIFTDAHVYQAVQLRNFAHKVPLLEPHSPGIGERVGEIEIPRLKLRAVVLHGDSPQVLRHGIGHLPGTSLPGEPGNVGLAGHRDSFFRSLRQIRAGDIITLRTFAGEFQYQVESTLVVSPANVAVLAPSEKSQLTLVTCFPFNFVGAAPDRFVVRAVRVSAE